MRALLAASALLLGTAVAAEPPSNPIEADGAVNVPAFRLPPSVYTSPEAKAALPRKPVTYAAQLDQLVASGRATQLRESMRRIAPPMQALAAKYKVRLEEGTVGGVRGIWVRPEAARTRRGGPVLVNLPGGGFVMSNASTTGMKESIPLAARTGYPVFSVNYRQAPEARFPAASEDVAAVYRDLLKAHRPHDIGLFGCSAGGLLTAQAIAWFDKERLPMPGAAGIFCASADARWAGDSWFWQRAMHGLTELPSLDERFYYGEHDLSDPLMSPIESDALLARFPPTLLITANRAGELSAAVNTHRLLVRNGVEADLHVWDGLDHGFYVNESLPESREAFAVMARFFTAHLGRRK